MNICIEYLWENYIFNNLFILYYYIIILLCCKHVYWISELLFGIITQKWLWKMSGPYRADNSSLIHPPRLYLYWIEPKLIRCFAIYWNIIQHIKGDCMMLTSSSQIHHIMQTSVETSAKWYSIQFELCLADKEKFIWQYIYRKSILSKI